jgi:glycopeptide antibiotics resistance protein
MSGVWQEWSALIIGAAVGTIAAVIATVLLARRRVRRGVPAGWAWRSTIAEIWMVAGTWPWVWGILTPTEGESRIVTPLGGLHEIIDPGPAWTAQQIGGNLLVFAAFGFLAPIRWRLRPVHVLLIGLSASALLETLQYVLDLGRITDLDDVIVNGGGAFLAALLSRRWWRRDTRSVTDYPEDALRTTSVGGGRYGERST